MKEVTWQEVTWREVVFVELDMKEPDTGMGEVTLGGEYTTFGGEEVTW